MSCGNDPGSPHTVCGVSLAETDVAPTDPVHVHPPEPWNRLDRARSILRHTHRLLADDLGGVLATGSAGHPRLVEPSELGSLALRAEASDASAASLRVAALRAQGAHLVSGPSRRPLPDDPVEIDRASDDGWCLLAPGAEGWDPVARHLKDLAELLVDGEWTVEVTLTAAGGRGKLDLRRDPVLWAPIQGAPWLEVGAGSNALDLLGGRRITTGQLVGLRAGQVPLPLAGPEPTSWLTARRVSGTSSQHRPAGACRIPPAARLLRSADGRDLLRVGSTTVAVPRDHAGLVVDVVLGTTASRCPADRVTCRVEIGGLLASAGLVAARPEPSEWEYDE